MSTEPEETIETLLHVPTVRLSVLMNAVQITLECADRYQAQVLFSDLVDRFEAGQEISITPGSEFSR